MGNYFHYVKNNNFASKKFYLTTVTNGHSCEPVVAHIAGIVLIKGLRKKKTT